MFKIGEFSKIAQIATSQLRFYDRIGLFQPITTDPINGYRYYQAAQLPKLHRILAMKELGLSLDEIQELLTEPVETDMLNTMLARKKAEIEAEVQAQVMRLQHIEARLKLAAKEKDVTQADVVLKALPARLFYGFRTTLPDIRQARMLIQELSAFFAYRPEKSKFTNLLVINHTKGFSMQSADLEIGYVVNSPIKKELTLSSSGHVLQMRTIAEVETTACVVRVGGPDKGYQCFESLGQWAEVHNYEIASPVYDFFIVPPKGNDLSDVVMEIQVPVMLRGATTAEK